MEGKMNSTLLDSLRFAENPNASSILSSRLKEMILSETLPAGFIFPNELAFCSQLGVGRGTLRDAYKELEALGFITRTKRGTYVNDKDTISRSMTLDATLKAAEFSDLLEFRKMFECGTVRLAAERASAEDIAAMEKSVEGLSSSSEASMQSDFDAAFHMDVARAAHNSIMEASMYSIIGLFRKFIFTSLSGDNGKRSPETRIYRAVWYHEKILEAIQERNPDDAEHYMMEHILDVHTK